jgi:hypothetical protein
MASFFIQFSPAPGESWRRDLSVILQKQKCVRVDEFIQSINKKDKTLMRRRQKFNTRDSREERKQKISMRHALFHSIIT